MARRILVVDDDDEVREVTRIALELLAGWEVISAPTGEEGLRAAARARPDAVLLDVMMPDLDGPATFRRLRGDPATAAIPVILLTGKVLEAERGDFDHLGVDGVLAKPFDPLELPRQVSEALGWAE
ncbi:MAG TPA: response regulator [Longimicrobiaceae bacterium]|nr:response regulator [Longimicrobiaceae bacterium]